MTRRVTPSCEVCAVRVGLPLWRRDWQPKRDCGEVNWSELQTEVCNMHLKKTWDKEAREANSCNTGGLIFARSYISVVFLSMCNRKKFPQEMLGCQSTPTPNFHSHSYKAMWAKCRAQRQRLGWSGVWKPSGSWMIRSAVAPKFKTASSNLL